MRARVISIEELLPSYPHTLLPYIRPLISRVAPQPGELALGVAAGVALQQAHGLGPVVFTVEEAENFLVAYRLQGVVVAVGEHAFYFVQQAGGQHVLNAQVDAL